MLECYSVCIYSGCGGNAIPLARVFHTLIASDIDPAKLRMLRCGCVCGCVLLHPVCVCRNNAAVCGAGDNLECVVSDAYAMLRNVIALQGPRTPASRPVDVVVLAPPW